MPIQRLIEARTTRAQKGRRSLITDATRSRAKVDEHALGAGTTLRFVLLLVFFTVSSAAMISDLLQLLHDPANNSLGCMLASGWDPEGAFRANIESTIGHNSQAYKTCSVRYALAWWVPVLVVVLLIAGAGALYWWLPVWKGRRSRVIPVEEIDRQEDLRPLLTELVLVAGLSRAPRFVVDPAAATTSAVVFGRSRRYTVCLHGGLVARRSAEGFRDVVLHELAHIRNGDVGITYATVSLWRVFLVAVLLPYVVREVQLLLSGRFFRTDSIDWMVWHGMVPEVTRNVLFSAFTVALVYLSRADILRTREIYADLTAVGWGASPGSWHHGSQGGADRSIIKSALGSFAELWRTHPRWDQRRHSLTDPSALFGLQALPIVLTGAAAALVDGQLQLFSGIAGNAWAVQAGTWLAAGLITGIVGVALWRAVTHAVLTTRRVPSGLRAGLWLGCGLVAGALLLYQTGGNNWIPSRPVVLLALVLLAIVVTCWTAQCAELWIKTRQGRPSRPAALLTLAGMWVILASWLIWWRDIGYLYLLGQLSSNAEWQDLKTLPESGVAHAGAPSTIVAIFLFVHPFGLLIVWAGAVLWLIPLLAWAMPSSTESPRSVHSALPDIHHPASPEKGLPSLGRVLLAAVLGGVSSWVAVAAVMAYMHSWPAPFAHWDDLFVWIYLAWLLVALTAGPVATATVMGAVATSYRLLVALITAGMAALIGLAGMLLLTAFDGCFGPLNTMESSCRWRPGEAWLTTEGFLPQLLGSGVFAAVVAALLATGLANLVRRLARQGVQPLRLRRPVNRQDNLAIRRVCVAVICVAALGLAGTQEVNPQFAYRNQSSHSDHLDAYLTATSSPSPEVRKFQIRAWYKYGGDGLFGNLAQIVSSISSILGALSQLPDPDAALKDGNSNFVLLRSACFDMEQWTKKADAYFVIPDSQGQLIWSKALVQIKEGSAGCQDALAQRNGTLLVTSLDEVLTATKPPNSALAWIDSQLTGFK
jgi:Zn-dependent protease with chaperone function